MSRQIYQVDLTEEAISNLQAQAVLAQVDIDCCFHTANNLRLPLGIYNVSMSRLCGKLVRLCGYLEKYFLASPKLEPLREEDNLMEEVIDYIELLLYAAAEHVDDTYAIASGFFRSKQLRDKNADYRKFDNNLKQHKRFLSAAANHLKHQQARIRIYSIEYSQAREEGCLHGYFIEGVELGVLGPSKTFHSQCDTFSITTLVWEAIMLILNCSSELGKFVGTVATVSGGISDIKSDSFNKAIKAAARLPIYTFGETHPFSRSIIKLKTDDKVNLSLDSGLYGSVLYGWSKAENAVFGRAASRFEGDGVSREFRFATPKTVSLHQWS